MKNLIKRSMVMLLSLYLVGCYGNWPTISEVADAIECDMEQNQIMLIGKRYQADVIWDESARRLTLAKADDAIAVIFKPKADEISVVALTQSTIHFGGLIRRQGDVLISKRCEVIVR